MVQNLRFFLTFSALILVYHIAEAQRTRNCSPGSFHQGRSCVPCPPGTYQDERGATACKPCPPGFVHNLMGATTIQACQPCPIRTFSSEEGGTECRPCADGTTAPEGADRCLSCPAGQFLSKCPQAFNTAEADVNGQCLVCNFGDICETVPVNLRCRPCSSGSFSPSRNSLSCTTCPPLTDSQGNAVRCETCPAGTGGDGCQTCDFFQFNNGSTSFCSRCPDGFRGNRRRGATRCIPCPPGTGGTLGRCPRCDPGQNSDVTGATHCQPDNSPCPDNFFLNDRGFCERCTEGQRYNRARNICIPCGRNRRSEGGVSGQCQRCPRGEIAVDERDGTRICDCRDGFARMPNGICRRCRAGFFKTPRGFSEDEFPAKACRACFAGSFSRRRGSSECTACPEGTIQPLNGQTECLRCPSGTMPDRFSVRCIDPATFGCPANRSLLEAAGLPCESRRPETPPCSVFQRFVVSRNECVRCPENTMSRGGMSRTCSECDGVFFSPFLGCQCLTLPGFALQLVNGRCEECPQGQVAIDQGVSGCRQCSAGSIPGSTRLNCRLCPEGTFSRSGDTSCRPCPEGTGGFIEGAANCIVPGTL